MTFRELLRRYQSYDPATGNFTVRRTALEYAALLGVHRVHLSRFYNGHVRDSPDLVRAFLRLYPHAAGELGRSLAAETEAANVAD